MTVTITVALGKDRLLQRKYPSLESAMVDVVRWLQEKHDEELAQEKRT